MTHASPSAEVRPWRALVALLFGFFMILVDTTIVSVANPAIMRSLNTDMNMVIWATSAFLLAYVVPLLIAGRLGDRFGPKNLYLIGLVIFTVASLWCGLSADIDSLIRARVLQGFGAALLSPQTMAIITRIFPPESRGAALGAWGSVAGAATLIGPIAGGLLVDGLGWEWIFFVNIPVGIIGFILACRLVPKLPTHPHRFDWVGVILSAVAMFLIVFGIQEGETYDWGTITGPITVWGLIIAGLAVLVVFLLWERFAKVEPLLPLGLFRDRNFSIANLSISTVGFAVISMGLPLIFFLQQVQGLTPTQSALMMTPMAVISGALAPFVGRLTNRVTPKYLAGFGMAMFALSLLWYSSMLHPDTPVWMLLLPSALLGIANGFMWAPLSSSAVRNLPLRQAGAGSGVYNTTRQVGAVIGSAATAALMQARLSAELPAAPQGSQGETPMGVLPPVLHEGFATAMGQALLLPAAVIFLGAILIMFQEKFAALRTVDAPQEAKID